MLHEGEKRKRVSVVSRYNFPTGFDIWADGPGISGQAFYHTTRQARIPDIYCRKLYVHFVHQANLRERSIGAGRKR